MSKLIDIFLLETKKHYVKNPDLKLNRWREALARKHGFSSVHEIRNHNTVNIDKRCTSLLIDEFYTPEVLSEMVGGEVSAYFITPEYKLVVVADGNPVTFTYDKEWQPV